MKTGVGVEVIWDKSAGSGWCGWQVHWSAGPTVAAMRAIAKRALREIAGLDPDALRYSRILGPRAIALAMIRQVWLGQPPLGDHEDLDVSRHPRRRGLPRPRQREGAGRGEQARPAQ